MASVNSSSGPDAAHGGMGWQPRERNSRQELGSIWARCGANSEYGKLLRVAMHRPHADLKKISDAAAVHWVEPLDLDKATRQFDKLCEVYERHGVEILRVQSDTPFPNLFFLRDLFAMTPAGAILMRPAAEVRSGEEVVVNRFLAENGVPVLLSVSGDGVFEGPDVLFFDKTSAFIGHGIRSNSKGGQQVSAALQLQGIETIEIQTTYGCGHLDGVLSIVGPRKAVLYPKRVSFRAYEILKQRGYSIVPLVDSVEADEFMSINMVALEPNLVLIPDRTPKLQETLREHGVRSIAVDVSELMKAGGAMHCLTGIVQREMI